MKHLILSILSLTFLYIANGQGTYTYKPVAFTINLNQDTAITNVLKSQADFNQMTDFEKQFVYNLNYARKYPQRFSKEALVPYLNAYPKLKPQYGDGLVSELSNLTPVRVLSADIRLVGIARMHAADLAKNNVMSHLSTNGTTTQQRFEKAGVGCGSECINMANSYNALEILLSLLIDYNVPNLGHRRSLLNPKMSSVGVGTGISSQNQLQYTVVDLGCR